MMAGVRSIVQKMQYDVCLPRFHVFVSWADLKYPRLGRRCQAKEPAVLGWLQGVTLADVPGGLGVLLEEGGSDDRCVVECQRQIPEILRDDQPSRIRGCLGRTLQGICEESYRNVVATRVSSRFGKYSNQPPEPHTDSGFLLCLPHGALLDGFPRLHDPPGERPGSQKRFFPPFDQDDFPVGILDDDVDGEDRSTRLNCSPSSPEVATVWLAFVPLGKRKTPKPCPLSSPNWCCHDGALRGARRWLPCKWGTRGSAGL